MLLPIIATASQTPSGWYGFTLGPPIFGDQQAARRQGVVADHLGIHAEARAAREQAVLGILLELLRRGRGRLAIGRRRDHQLEELLHVPARLAELDGQPVEQLRMRWAARPEPKSPAVLHQARAEDLLPEAIDRDAGRQRILGSTSHCARPSRLRGRSPAMGGSTAGTPGVTSSRG